MLYFDHFPACSWQIETPMTAQHKGPIQAFADSSKCHQEISLGHHTVLQPTHFHPASEGTCCSYYSPLLLLLNYFIHTVKLAYNVSSALKKKNQHLLCSCKSFRKRRGIQKAKYPTKSVALSSVAAVIFKTLPQVHKDHKNE